MPQISFTPRNSDVYDRFSRLLLEEQLKRGKLTAPQFLDLVLDAFEKSNVENLQEKEAAYNFLCNLEAFAKTLGEAGHLHGKVFVIVPLYFERRFEIFTPSYIVDSSPDRWELAGSFDLPKNELR